MKSIKVKISQTGESEVTVKGACGDECQGLVSPIEKALGKTVDSVRTSDFNRRSTSVTQTQEVRR